MVSQIKVNEIIKQSGSSISIGESGDTINLAGSAYAVAANTPSFIATKTSNQTGVSDNTFTKVTWDNVVHDSNSGFSTSDNRYTVPSGQGGIYQISFTNYMGGASASFNYHQTRLYKNGSHLSPYSIEYNDDGFNTEAYNPCMSLCVSLAAGDYIEVYGRLDVSSGDVTIAGENVFTGFKLVGA
jgi:hypothetical protein